jgi:hypothetical protein
VVQIATKILEDDEVRIVSSKCVPGWVVKRDGMYCLAVGV